MYEAPSIFDLGKVSDLTLALSDGNALDQDFPAGTPQDDLTFS